MTTLEDLIEAFSASLRRGVTPDIDAFVQRAPEHAEALYALLPTLLKMEAFAQESTGLPSEIELPLPHLLNAEFRLERQIGRGGMGNVFEAVQLPLERPCAVKVLARHLAADKHHREAFIREARIIGKLHHPHIVKVFSAGETDEYAYYAMESVHGQSLDRALPIGKHQLATFALHAALALAYAHQCGIIHCDIKPSNLLIDQGQRLLVSDFGLARLNEREDPQATPTYSGGTRAYMAPECREHHSFTAAADQYAFGITFSEIAAECEIHDADLKAIFARCSAADPAQRYPNMDEVVAELRHFLAGEPVSARPLSFPRRLKFFAKRRPFLTASLALLSIGLPLFTALLALSHQKTLHALAEAEANLTIADTALACTFEHISQSEPSYRTAMLLNELIPYYRDIIQRRDASTTRLATAESIIAAIALHIGDYEAAVNACQRQYDAAPTLEAANQLAHALRKKGDLDAANTHYQLSATHLVDPNPANQIEAVRAQCALGMAAGAAPLLRALKTLRPHLTADPTNPDLQHLYYALIEQLPEADLPIVDQNTKNTLLAQRLLLADAHPDIPEYGIAALHQMTQRLSQPSPLTSEEETLLRSARKVTQSLLGRWPDDPDILLTVVRFSVADNNHPHRNPFLQRQAQRAAEQLTGILEVHFLGSSLPEDIRDPLFESLFSTLLENQKHIYRQRAGYLRRRIRNTLPKHLERHR